MPEPLLLLGLLSAGYLAFKRRKDPGELSPYDELKQEYRRVRDAARHSRRTLRMFKKRLDTYGKSFKSRGDKFLPIVSQLFAEEFTKKKLPKRSSGEAELKRFRKWFDQYKDKVENLHRTLPLFYDTLFQMYQKFESTVPLPSQCKSHELPVLLIDKVGNPGKLVEEILQPINHPDVVSAGLFSKLREQVKYAESIHGRPCKFEGRPQAMIDAYLKELHMDHLLDGTVPFTIPLERQLEHSMLAAGSRYGKSQLIGWLIASHLQSEDPPGIIVVDSTGDFLEKISRLEVFSPTGRLAGRLLVIDPADSPQLNMFDVSRFDWKGYSSEDMEQVEAATLKLFDYVFASIGSDLTSQQGTGFNFLVRLLLTIPGSTLTTLKDILELPARNYSEVPGPIRTAIEKLDRNTQTFFKNQFFTLTMLTTRLGVARRLYNLLQIPTFERMFSGANRIDFFKAMNNGLIIVVNTSANRLQDASPLFGRYIIARVMSAAFERTVIKDMNQRRPCLLFVDEAQEYFDKSIDTMLTQIGKYRLGLFIAFQYFDQLDDKLRKSVLGNTTVKYAGGGLGATEAHMIAKELRVDDKLVMSLKKDSSKKPHWAQFATYINFVTERALSITVPFYALENMPKMTDAEHKELLTKNRERVAGKTEPPKSEKRAPEPPPKSTPEPEEKPLEDFE